MATPSDRARLIRDFPNLASEDFEIVCQACDAYNCIAYAAGDTGRPWSDEPEDYWPPQVLRNPTIRGLENLFKWLGFKKCHGPRLEPGYQKVALYASKNLWTHAALQMQNGCWRSKLGKKGPLIEHQTPHGVAGPAAFDRSSDRWGPGVSGVNRSSRDKDEESYGRPYVYMRQRIQG